ncbi:MULTISPECIES: geranylgeranylglycerol-phosphate geranylgeranyltransferase [unclassified Leptolyngbya]|uniref:geranylgeranylglycerol-phosphate geranylgeranyltransferase n=1 Tax=unclassified Leptolyngbya TaxID=2650499 RepID=UPI001681DA29|nr:MULTISPECIES: geranylgeranylglycerol-phosphate geranylgeranyltransferase [unclassified Leptolyngbya]MBD1913865.1 geranylgeranylglycerol-phosphate geranylgeranyltransferase [Leptolyngbya sp. FACHB-8]MBD2157375.1 geranylgeranylglycerol-phosphate geranylgeranyltransferase [Leptolyngbya sp. FACHB-16]
MDTPHTSPNASNPGQRLRDFAQLFRLPVGIMAGIAGCATIVALNHTVPVHHYWLTALILFCMMSAACAINDYWDVEKDRVDHPERPLPSGRLMPQQVWYTAAILFGCALVASIPLGIYPFLLVAVSTAVLWEYSHLLTLNGILGNLIVATVISGLIFLGSLVAGRPFAMLYPIGFLFCLAFAKEVVWDIHDAEGDRRQGIVTIANRLGDQTAFTIAWGLLILLLGSIPLAVTLLPMAHPWVFTVFALITVISLGIALARFQTQRSSQTYEAFVLWDRLSMVFGVVALLGTAAPLSV